MAEIEMERRPKRNAWTWIVLLLVLAGVAFGAWLAFSGDVDIGTEPAQESTTIVPEPVTEPATPIQEPPSGETGEALDGATSGGAPPPDDGGGVYTPPGG